MTELLLDPSHPDAPKYWANEASGDLKPAILAYTQGQPLTVRDVSLLSAYFAQWVNSPVWDRNPHADEHSKKMLFALRMTAPRLRSRVDIGEWLALAVEQGLDPI